MVRLLLQQKDIDVNAKDNNDNTPLHKAAESENTKVVLALLENSANVNAENIKKDTPIFICLTSYLISSSTLHKPPEIFFLLLVYDATLNKDDRKKINQNSSLKKCLTAFKAIKKNLHLIRLIKIYKNGDKTESAKAISQYINNEPDCIDLIIKAFKKVKKLCDPHKELSTILEYFISIIEDISDTAGTPEKSLQEIEMTECNDDNLINLTDDDSANLIPVEDKQVCKLLTVLEAYKREPNTRLTEIIEPKSKRSKCSIQ